MAPQNIIQLFCRMCLIILVFEFGLGCSRDKQSEPRKKPVKVVRSIVTHPVKKEQAVKEIPKPVKAEPVEEKEEKPKTNIEQSESKAIKTEEMTSKEATGSRKQEDVPEDKTPANIYTVKSGENLALIAGRNEVFGDPIMWPILYRLNYDQLKYLSGSNNLPSQELPQGMKLTIITEKEKKRNLEQRKNQYWVVNVLSSPTAEEIIQTTDRLIKNGYPAYITQTHINGKKYQRLRVGFFTTKKEADKIGRNIMSKLKLKAFWSVKIGNVEFGKYAGY